jgi:enoyl-CoA hydratase
VTAPDDELVVARDGAVLSLRLNRPDSRNALTPGLLAALGEQSAAAEADPTVRVLVVTGTGDRAFCAGMDLRAFSSGDAMTVTPDAMAAYNRLIGGELTIPVVGAANATAVGGGLELLLGCDIVVASRDARFGMPEVKRGLFPAGGGTLIGTRIPLGVALEMTMTGDLIDATRAYELGLVNAVVEPNAVLPTAHDYAGRIAANAPLGLAAVKELVRLGVSDADRWKERLDHWRAVVFASEDAKEGAAAFVEQRTPEWQGK